MIISKAALQLVNIAGGNKMVPVFNCVCLEPDGSIVASNGRLLGLVSPVTDKIKAAVPLGHKESAEIFGERILLTADAVRTILKSLPRDTQFKGLLEHVSLWLPEPKAMSVKIEITDGRRRQEMTLRRMETEYIPYEKLLHESAAGRLQGGNENIQCVLNRRRMALLVDALDKVCPYDGEFSPVYWEFTKAGHVIIRAMNELTGQRLLSVFGVAQWQDGQWMEWNEWENKICGVNMWMIMERKCNVCGNSMHQHITDGTVECSYIHCPTRLIVKRKAVKLSVIRKAVKLNNRLSG